MDESFNASLIDKVSVSDALAEKKVAIANPIVRYLFFIYTDFGTKVKQYF